MVIEIHPFESPDITALHFCLWIWMNREFHKRKATHGTNLSRMMDDAVRIKKRDYQLSRTASDLHTLAAKCTEVDGGIFEVYCEL